MQKFLSQQNQCCNTACDLELWCDLRCYITIFRPDYIGWLVQCFMSLKKTDHTSFFLNIGALLTESEKNCHWQFLPCLALCLVVALIDIIPLLEKLRLAYQRLRQVMN